MRIDKCFDRCQGLLIVEIVKDHWCVLEHCLIRWWFCALRVVLFSCCPAWHRNRLSFTSYQLSFLSVLSGPFGYTYSCD